MALGGIGDLAFVFDATGAGIARLSRIAGIARRAVGEHLRACFRPLVAVPGAAESDALIARFPRADPRFLGAFHGRRVTPERLEALGAGVRARRSFAPARNAFARAT